MNNEKVLNVDNETVEDIELKEIAEELNKFMKEKKVALQPYIRPIINELGFKTADVAAVELVRYERE